MAIVPAVRSPASGRAAGRVPGDIQGAQRPCVMDRVADAQPADRVPGDIQGTLRPAIFLDAFPVTGGAAIPQLRLAIKPPAVFGRAAISFKPVRPAIKAPVGAVPAIRLLDLPIPPQTLPAIKSPVGALPVQVFTPVPIHPAIRSPLSGFPADVFTPPPPPATRDAIRPLVGGLAAALIRGATGIGGTVRPSIDAPVGGLPVSLDAAPVTPIHLAIKAHGFGHPAELTPLVPPAPADRSVVKLDRPTGRPVALAGPAPDPEHPHTTPKVASHCDDAIARLAEQFKHLPDLKAWICAFTQQAQQLDQALSDVMAFRSIETALGEQLDHLGRDMRLPRHGVSDDIYRTRLRAQALVIASKGTGDQLLLILLTLDDGFDPHAIHLVEHYPAGLTLSIRVGAGQQLVGELYARMIHRAKGGGIRLVLRFHQNGLPLFTFSDSTDPNAAGWAELTAGTPGGNWADAV